MTQATAFFNRSHLIQGAQILAIAFCMLGTIFIGLDMMRIGWVRPKTFAWIGVGAALAACAALASRRVRTGAAALFAGVLLGLLYFGAAWLWVKAG